MAAGYAPVEQQGGLRARQHEDGKAENGAVERVQGVDGLGQHVAFDAFGARDEGGPPASPSSSRRRSVRLRGEAMHKKQMPTRVGRLLMTKYSSAPMQAENAMAFEANPLHEAHEQLRPKRQQAPQPYADGKPGDEGERCRTMAP